MLIAVGKASSQCLFGLTQESSGLPIMHLHRGCERTGELGYDIEMRRQIADNINPEPAPLGPERAVAIGTGAGVACDIHKAEALARRGAASLHEPFTGGAPIRGGQLACANCERRDFGAPYWP